MGGGEIQLKYIGKEGQLFIGNPQISFFKSIFKQYGNFSKELINVNFESDVKFGKLTYCNLLGHGDLINNMYLNFVINYNVDKFDLTIIDGVFSSITESVFNEYNSQGISNIFLYNWNYVLKNTNISDLVIKENSSSSSGNLYNSVTNTILLDNVTSTRLYYSFTQSSVDYVGYIYIRELKEDMTKIIKKTNIRIDEYVIEEHNTDWLLMYNNLFNTDDNKNYINEELKYLTPKHFNKDIRFYIPLRFWFTKDTTSSLPIGALHKSDVNITMEFNSIEDIFLSHKIYTKAEISSGTLSIDYINLDVAEKLYFLNNKLNLLVEQVQYYDDIITNNMSNTIKLQFNGLSKMILWKLPYKYILNKAQILLNNNPLCNLIEGEYFHLIQRLEYNLGSTTNIYRMEDNTNKAGTYYMYSFSLHPTSVQPSGLCNFSRIDEKILIVEPEYIVNTINTNTKIPIELFNITYNFLVINNGKCKLQF
tara:strand:- start:1496 stop:2929 length:1434 start_codon:yes stop_codon:yes gene_type:complete